MASKKTPAKKSAPTKKSAPAKKAATKPVASDEDRLAKQQGRLTNARLRTEIKGPGPAGINDLRYRIASNRVQKIETRMGMWPEAKGSSSPNRSRGNSGVAGGRGLRGFFGGGLNNRGK